MSELKIIKQHLESLDEPYRSKAINNAESYMLKRGCIGTSVAIQSAFKWNELPEGFEYWDDLCDELIEEELNKTT